MMVAHIMEADNTQLMEPSSPLRKEVSKLNLIYNCECSIVLLLMCSAKRT